MTRRCAIYARFSSALQRESSIEDQIRNCRAFSGEKGWLVIEDYVVADRAVTGEVLAGRDSLQWLLDAAKKKPSPFDCILIDDTSRLARDLGDSLKIEKMLRFYGIYLVFVTNGLGAWQE